MTHAPRSIGRRRWLVPATGLTLGALALAGCGSAPVVGDGTVALDYWLWDANQLPAYQRCVDAFEEENSDVSVRISQYGWDDYWTKLTAAFVAGAGPDVFTDHLNRYPEYVQRGLLRDLGSLDATSDFDPADFQEGLADLWTGPDGKQYGSPKDFDTIALFYNTEMVEEAGLTSEDLANLDWNPRDGGSFEDVIARLTVDANGVRGDEEGFDPDNVATYGLASNGSGGTDGQTVWSWLAGSTGWTFTNADVWGDEYNYDDPRLQDSLAWLFSLVDKGYMAPYQEVGTEPNPQQALGSGRAAISANGSWMINTYAGLEGIELGIASVPSGPVGHPVSMYNGLADSISAQSEHPEEAARLVEFLGSDECQTIVGEAAVVFPARPAGTEAAIEAFAEKGIDVSPFTDLVENNHTILFPVTDQYGSIQSLMTPVMDEIYIGDRDVSTLTQLNEQVNDLLK
ncbi:ABC transporter substrate-binding protein [Phytoactinopolyspora halotolerans]|uniref:Sugar ABC transporter substrate-binding protein n=1 Tax=Phytoactinopolyspora halotolerans TaxID=1981512 RepID=A0A6L9S2F0_9ACTN|nr:sugar ABC transporter substrate-binding protein [Phytoactinopolyspora halotolerans]NED99242.1 sugar ABC transporter substrate-binding protein [Phytoactinopolyspora halotolerans]